MPWIEERAEVSDQAWRKKVASAFCARAADFRLCVEYRRKPKLQPARLIALDTISSRINELKTAAAQGVVASEIRRRSWRVTQLQTVVDDLLALRAARQVLYANQLDEGYDFEVVDSAQEARALADGCRPLPPIASAPEFPKMMQHPGFPMGGETGCW